MNKPVGYDTAQIFGQAQILPAGGYKCIIKNAVCAKTQNQKEYLKLEIDIAEGEYKDFYANKHKNDTRENKKWSGTWTIFIEGYEPETTNRVFKGLIELIKQSNENFTFQWNVEGNEKSLIGKKIGIVFRVEEFMTQDGQIKKATKPYFAVKYDDVEKVQAPPEKLLNNSNEKSLDTTIDSELYMIDIENNLPF